MKTCVTTENAECLVSRIVVKRVWRTIRLAPASSIYLQLRTMAADLPHIASGATMAQPHVTKAQIAVLWLRRDLRVADNPALVAALQAAVTVVRCFGQPHCTPFKPLPRLCQFYPPPRPRDLYPPVRWPPSRGRGDWRNHVHADRVTTSHACLCCRCPSSCGPQRKRASSSRAAARGGGSCRACGPSRRTSRLWAAN